eukprot:3134549-Amphidinium_carterae.1
MLSQFDRTTSTSTSAPPVVGITVKWPSHKLDPASRWPQGLGAFVSWYHQTSRVTVKQRGHMGTKHKIAVRLPPSVKPNLGCSAFRIRFSTVRPPAARTPWQGSLSLAAT